MPLLFSAWGGGELVRLREGVEGARPPVGLPELGVEEVGSRVLLLELEVALLPGLYLDVPQEGFLVGLGVLAGVRSARVLLQPGPVNISNTLCS